MSQTQLYQFYIFFKSVLKAIIFRKLRGFLKIKKIRTKKKIQMKCIKKYVKLKTKFKSLYKESKKNNLLIFN